MDERKRKVLRAVVALYGLDGEPVGSGLLAEHFGRAVSSATLRNEMAALTKLGLLEQPHTSAGRVPSAKGYRYYIDNLMDAPAQLSAQDKKQTQAMFREMDFDPDRLAQSAARALSDWTGYAVVATTPKSDDIYIAHFLRRRCWPSPAQAACARAPQSWILHWRPVNAPPWLRR